MIQRRKVWCLSFSNSFRMSSYHFLLSCFGLEKIWDIPEFHIRPYCHIWDCRSGFDSRMNVIESAFESSDTMLFDHKKFSNIRTHPEELRVVKSKKCCYIHIISSKIFFSRRVVLMLQTFLWSKSMVSELSYALSTMIIRLSKPLVQSHIWQ